MRIPYEDRFSDLEPLLARVEKPSRYIDHEWGTLSSAEADYRACLIYPDVYEVGLPNQGLTILYNILNHQEGISCERAYLPWIDMADAMREVKELGYAVGLHTGGYRPEHLEKVLPLVNWVGMDIKAPFEKERYREVTKTDHLEKVLKSLDLLLQAGIDFECRTTCDPRLLKPADLKKMAEDLYAKGVKKYFLQQYRPIPTDTVTTDADCEGIFADKGLIEYIKAMFEEFEIRK